jgi:hypothetical protein
MSIKIKYTLLFAIFALSMNGQGGLNSPFSLYGIGNTADRGYMHLRQMGGLGSSFFDIYHLNFENPATLSHLRATAFDMGIEVQNSRLSDPNNQSSVWSGNLGYIGMGFPLRNPLNEVFTNEDYKFNWGMGFSLTPISSISYEITTTDNLEEVGQLDRRYTGDGGFYKATWGNSIKYSDFSIGANIGFLFGRDQYTRSVDFVDEIAAHDNNFESSYSARGLYWDAGLLYVYTLNKDEIAANPLSTEAQYISFGLTGKSNTGFNTTSQVLDVNFLPNSFFTDTLSFASDVKGKGVLPGELGFGMTYHHKNKYGIGFDVKRTFWSNYRNDAKPDQLDNTLRVALGGYYRPNYKSLNSFLSRVHYRFGVYLDQDPRLIEGNKVDNYGLTFGLGLPFAWQRKFSHMNVGLNIGRRSADNIISETYFKINFGFTFNDNEWFIKRKYN